MMKKRSVKLSWLFFHDVRLILLITHFNQDIFDLSRVPDVHDNVRFDMLHNPHLGLTSTLSTLYDLAKSMADCVVPQEYGITLEEKRDIGCKMCATLLDKINFDLAIARTDNQVDMRYLINMDYSSDLPINSMGRRVRSRLYFTSESHLHSLLNVLRISSSKDNCVKSPLSAQGRQILADASELCYLTQVVIRLFEDTQKSIEDPKRFRVEIWFSPGATATPMHMESMYREDDSSRFDTEKLQKISIEGLSCNQVEEYFAEAMKDGKPKRDLSKTNEEEEKKAKKKQKGDKSAVVAQSDESALQSNKDVKSISPLESNGQADGEGEKSSSHLDQPVKEEKIRKVIDGDLRSKDSTGRVVMAYGFAIGAAAILSLLFLRGRGMKR